MSLILKNPHSVLAALNRRPRDVKQVSVSAHPEDAWEQVESLARKNGVPVQKTAGKNPAPGRGSGNQAVVAEIEPCPLEELFGPAPVDPNAPALWLALDCLQDPHNIGAIFRTASFFSVRGILITQERSAPLSATVYDVASGGIEDVRFSVLVNLQRGLEAAKKAGVWILGSSEHAKDPIGKIPRDRPWLLVLGNEEHGMRRLTAEKCDMLCAVRGRGEVQSLNVSVASGILISTLS